MIKPNKISLWTRDKKQVFAKIYSGFGVVGLDWQKIAVKVSQKLAEFKQTPKRPQWMQQLTPLQIQVYLKQGKTVVITNQSLKLLGFVKLHDYTDKKIIELGSLVSFDKQIIIGNILVDKMISLAKPGNQLIAVCAKSNFVANKFFQKRKDFVITQDKEIKNVKSLIGDKNPRIFYLYTKSLLQ